MSNILLVNYFLISPTVTKLCAFKDLLQKKLNSRSTSSSIDEILDGFRIIIASLRPLIHLFKSPEYQDTLKSVVFPSGRVAPGQDNSSSSRRLSTRN
uniref:WSN domain-containing protein n=1 Tax=Caenorhabditis tropicalis TaxID=1561998 RepID=A0A1I7UI69_9PELO